MLCPRCEGARSIIVLAKYRDGCRLGPMTCYECHGTGSVSDERTQWIEAGKALRDSRLAADRSLSEEAKRRGIRPSVLSDMEHGRIKPEPIP